MRRTLLIGLCLLGACGGPADPDFTKPFPLSGADRLSTGDFDRDGHLDLLVDGIDSGVVTLLLGTRRGFRSIMEMALGPGGAQSGAPTIAVEDFNRDGRLDFVRLPQSTTAWLGDGAGGFQAPINRPIDPDSTAIVASDFNGDGNADLVLAGYAGVGRLVPGDGRGRFAPPIEDGLGDSNWALAVGDFNGDGKLDVAEAGEVVSVLVGDGKGGLAQFNSGSCEGNWLPLRVAAGDLDGDGADDVVYPCNGDIELLPGGDANAVERTIVASKGPVWSIAIADMNGDGWRDVVFTNSDGASIALGDGKGAIERVDAIKETQGSDAVAVGDFNGDGYLDLAIADSKERTVRVVINPYH